MVQPQQPVDVYQTGVKCGFEPPQEQERAPVTDLAAAHPLPVDNAHDVDALSLRIKTLEDRRKPSMASLKKAVTQYCLRPLSDFDTYKAVDMVEQLANVSLQVKDKKADYYATVYSTLQERISKLAEQLSRMCYHY